MKVTDINNFEKDVKPNIIGLYYFYKVNELVYIGHSLDIRARMFKYRNIRNFQSQVHFEEVTRIVIRKGQEWYDREAEEIEIHKPKWNIEGNPEYNPADEYCYICKR